MVHRHSNPFTSEAIAYAWYQLLERAGADPHSFSVSLVYGQAEAVSLPTVVVCACDIGAWHCLLQQAPDTLSWLPARDALPRGADGPLTDPVPVLLWGQNANAENTPFAELRSDGALIFHADIIASTLFMLTRWEEVVVPVRDKHDRFPATASLAYNQGFLDRPIVDEYALVLKEWLKVLRPEWEPVPRQFSVKLSHDVDNIRRFPYLSAAVRTLGRDLVKHRSLKQACLTVRDTISQTVAPAQTTYFKGIQALVDVSCEQGLGNDAFYLMAATPGNLDNDYDPDSPLMRACIDNLQRQGFELGFHASYHSLDDPERLIEEKNRLQAIIGQRVQGGRQHYLRFLVPDTWRHWEEAGLTYDATMGYADHEGFRCGTCHPFRPYDLERNRGLNLWEHPLIVMEKTLRDYRGLTPEQAEVRILELAHRCRRVGGEFTLLWHNSSLSGEWRHWALMYRRVVGTLAEMNGDG